ncbi:DUF1549 and DUF1553 domain-containing protein [Methylococcus sp. EFPC2]|uniref:DUF1549 and DUF1553 domain-containing protein n=1 Tax=Methylococcus sp. EFPC2 TaxID=2812648 RepID=UPI0019685FD9|nr:DUF1549 and DUF1553 domain-containing protein [Methylococcus sp. EFPC2]QSA96435.1 DUF1553 domain-containing protein [Methylococcus sp. EFPC2]
MRNTLYSAVLLSLSAAAATAADNPQAQPGQSAAAAEAPAKKDNKLWSWQPVQSVAVPQVQHKDWIRTPIDAFVAAKQEAAGLDPAPEADRAAFIRRATLDAWGLIPTPEEVQAFVSDQSPNAYEKLVDRLLASPRYGERQARRWLDLARYADSQGFDNDQTRPNMWRYRDYVVDAFNQDKPYTQFIKEQLAGDELWPDKQDALIATGFLRGFPDNPNGRDLVQKKYQHTTDITDTVGKVFLAQTVECARCHNHKFDKISQKDYFALQAFFANSIGVDNIPVAQKGQQEIEYEKAWAKYEEALKPIKEAKKALIDPVREAANKYYKERYNEATLVSLNKPQSEWNAHDRWVNAAYGSYIDDDRLSNYLQDTSINKDAPDYNAENAPRWEAYKKLREEVRKLDKLRPEGSVAVSAMSELGHSDAPPTYVLFGGLLERPLDEVQPAFPENLTSEKPVIVPTATSSGRRTALANWIASEKNPLTARVFVNRVWEQYFGRGIVETVSDFGKAGTKPTNPELLDYLADNFVHNDWSVKKLHRDILLSSVYRQSSSHREDAYKVDPDNNLLAVFPRKRLEAEEIRDSLLAASGKLDEKLGGPSVFPPIPANLVVGNSNVDGSSYWRVSKDERDHNRRSLYVFTRRSVAYPLLEPFDMATPQEVHSKRDVTTTPLQALTLLHSDVVFGWSKALAGRVINEAGKEESAQLDRLYQILFARTPDRAEKDALQAFLTTQEKVIKQKAAAGKFGLNVPTGLKDAESLDPIRAAAFVDLVHTVANSNEFAYRL